MGAFIDPPTKIPFYLKIGIWVSNRVIGRDLLPPKLLAWYPKAAISSGILEALVANGKRDLDKRLLKIIRIQTSLTVSCPFCLDMNSFEYGQAGITNQEISALQGLTDLETVTTFSPQEKLVIKYVKCIAQTPIAVPADLVKELAKYFNEREIVIIATTCAQVDYWARLLQALGVPPAGFSDTCQVNRAGRQPMHAGEDF